VGKRAKVEAGDEGVSKLLSGRSRGFSNMGVSYKGERLWAMTTGEAEEARSSRSKVVEIFRVRHRSSSSSVHIGGLGRWIVRYVALSLDQ